MSSKKLSDSKTNKLIEEVKANVTRWYDYFGHNISNFRDDKRFGNGEQWSDWEINNYKARSIEPLTHNLLKPVVRQIVGEANNMQPALNLSPIDESNSNPANTRLIQNLVRYTAYGSHASQAYSTALLNMCMGGWGVIGTGTKYTDPRKFDQEIIIRTFTEPQNVGFDPLAKTPSKRDGEFCFCWEAIHKDNFEKSYPGKEVPTGASLLGSNRSYLDMLDGDYVVVFEYYRREYKSKTLIQLTNGFDYKIEVFQEDVEAATEQYLQMMTQRGIPLLNIPMLTETNKRDTKICKIRCYKLTGTEVLEHYDYPDDKHLPFIFVDCMSQFRDGKQYTESFISGAKIPQQVYNYAMTEITAGVRRARKESVYMTPKQMAGHEEVYANPDRQKGAKPYSPDPLAPQGPIITQPETISQHWFVLAEQAREDIQRTLGIYEPNRGELPNQTSGVAIGKTITQGNLALIQLWQNLYGGMQASGENSLALIPNVYDNERIVSLLDESGQQENATLNQVQPGGQVQNDVTAATYKLQVKPVASFAMQLEAEKSFLLNLMQIVPQSQAVLVDKVASRLDSPITPEIVQRLQTLVPPAVLAKEKGLPPPPPAPPSPQDQLVMGQIKTMMAQQQKIMEEIQNMRADRELKKEQLQFNKVKHTNEIKLQVTDQNLKEEELIADVQKVQMKTGADIQTAQMNAQAKILTGMAALKKAQEQRKPLH